jgi:dihydrolipoamide dehydrogenase
MYDIVVIGAGPAGYEVAFLLANDKKKVCIIDKDISNIGGTCLNEGCVPAKNFLESSLYLKKNNYFKSCGVNLEFKSFDINKLQQQTTNLISTLKNGIMANFKKNKIDIKYGVASFLDEKTIQINDKETIKAQKIIIASGSKHKNHPTIPLVKDKIIYSKDVFSLEKIPKSILIIGGGAIGCEFASFFNSFDCQVQIAEFTPTLVPNEDIDIARTLKRELEKQNIKIYLKANIKNYEIVENGVKVDINLGNKTITNTYEKILISIGREPNTKSLNLKNANIKSENNFIKIDEKYQTSTKNIYAIGDVIQTPALAHIAYWEAKKLAKIILQNDNMPQSAIFPSVTFCSPQVASIGKNEKELKQKNINFKVKKIFYKANAKAKIKGFDGGFVKILFDETSHKILGASIIGDDATELIHQFLIIINSKLTIDDISSMIFAHPTLSEVIG